MYAEIVPLRKTGTREVFTYKIPSSFQKKAKKGVFVEIPFGKKTTKGIILNTTFKKPSLKTKEIKNIFPFPPLFSWQIKLANWIAEYYSASLGKTLNLFAPPFLKKLSPIKKSSKTLKFPKINLTLSQKKALLKITQTNQTLFPPSGFLLETPFYEEKWKIYLALAQKASKNEEQILLIFPEKSHLKKAEKIFKKNGLPFASFYGEIKTQEKLAIFLKANSKKIFIVLGLKSALFLPFSNLKIIVIDEEQNPSYKEEREPRLEIEKVALRLAEILNIKIVFQTTAPSLFSFWKIKRGEFSFARVFRKKSYKIPFIKIFDLQKEKKSKNLIKEGVKKEIKKALGEKKRIILYLERKGFSSLVCDNCSYVFRCPSCQRALLLIQKGEKYLLFCPLCYLKNPAPTFCPKCKGHKLSEIGAGIEKLSKEIKENFPNTSWVQIDSNTIKTKKDLLQKEKEIKKKNPQIIATTRLIFSFSQIKKADVFVFVLPEINFNLPDFRIEEKVFCTIKEAIFHFVKRKGGKVLIQTYFSRHPLFKSLIKLSDNSFYQFQLEQRKKLLLPPFSKILKLSYSGVSFEKAQQEVEKVILQIKNLALRKKIPIIISGPSLGFSGKIKGRHIFNIILKVSPDFSFKPLLPILEKLSSSWKKDINPQKLL